MSTIDLLEPLFTDGIASPSYFNGRVLSAEDLAQESDARRQVSRLLGQAIGDGVAYGLDVSIAAGEGGVPTVRVEPGLAINRRGAPVRLSSFQLVHLAAQTSVTGGSPGFADCGEATGPPFTGDAGVYVLTIGPVQGNRGLAPVTGLRNVTSACNIREVVEGVQFRMIALALSGTDSGSSRLRSVVATRFLGIESLAALKGFAPGMDISSYGALDDLRQARVLTECEVPLATIRLTGTGIAFVDRWSVRRRPVRRAAELRWPHLVGDRRVAEAEAHLLQFEEQLADLAPAGTNVSAIGASTHFAWLPPAGVLPVGGNRFKPASFFKDQTLQTLVGDHALARQVIHDSFYREPFRSDDEDVVLRVLEFEDHPEYVVFTRIEPLPVQPPVEPTPAPGPGGFEIRVTWPTSGVALDPATLRPMPVIEAVWAQDESGKRFDAVALKQAAGDVLVGSAGPEVTERFQLGGLAPGKYLVKAQSRGFPIASTSATAIAKSSVLVQLRLHPYRKPCPRKRGKRKPIDVIKAEAGAPFVDVTGNTYGSVVVMHDYLTTADQVPSSFVAADRMQLSEAMVDRVLADWDCLLELEPDLPLVTDVVIPEILIEPMYVPVEFPPPDDPYCFVVIDDLAYPVILTPENRTLPGSVPASAAGIPGVTLERYVSTLEPMGLGEIDVLAGAWGSLLQESLELPAVTIGNVAENLATEAKAAAQQMLYYPGMTPELGSALAEAGWDNVAIANATVEELAAGIASLQGVEVTNQQAESLAVHFVAVAHEIVPESAWSLADPALGLDQATRDALIEAGVSTKGALASADEATVAAVAESTGTGLEAIATAKTQSEVAVNVISAALKPEQTLTEIGFTRDQAATLVASGITSASGLAATEINLVETLGIAEEQATELNAKAVEAATANLGNVSVVDTATFNNALGDLASKPVFAGIAPLVIGRNR